MAADDKYRGMFEFGVSVGLGIASWMCGCAVGSAASCGLPGVAVLFFGTVNQVLVRLWARVLGMVCGCRRGGWSFD